MGCSASAARAGTFPLPVQCSEKRASVSFSQPMPASEGVTSQPSAAPGMRPSSESVSTEADGKLDHDDASTQRRSNESFGPARMNSKGSDSISRMSNALRQGSSYVGAELMTLVAQHPELQTVAILLAAATAVARSAQALRSGVLHIVHLLRQVEDGLVQQGQSVSRLTGLKELTSVLSDVIQALQRLRRPDTSTFSGKMAAVLQSSWQMESAQLLSGLRRRLSLCTKALRTGLWLPEPPAAIAPVALQDNEPDLQPSTFDNPSNSPERSPGSALGRVGPDRHLLSSTDSVGLCTPDTSLDAYETKALQGVPSDAPLFEISAPKAAPDDCASAGDIQAALLHSQAQQLAAVMNQGAMTPQQFITKWPLAPNEAARLEAVHKLRLIEVASRVDVADVTRHLAARFQASYVSACVMGYDSLHVMHLIAGGVLLGEAPETPAPVERSSMLIPRKVSMCQHTLASEADVTHVPMDRWGEVFDLNVVTNAELGALDAGIASTAALLASGVKDPVLQGIVVLTSKIKQAEAAGQELPMEHSGVPIKMLGQNVGALCVLHPKGACGGDSAAALLAAAAEVSSRLEAAAGRHEE